MNKFVLILIVLTIATYLPSYAQLQVAEIFTDNMVIQQSQPIKVWGWSKKNQKVAVSFNGKSSVAKANRSGKWLAQLPPMRAGGPYEMSVKAGAENINISNILIGDVWLCSGQSNMEWPVTLTNNADEEIAKANDDQIRHFKVPLTHSKQPQERLDSSAWGINNPKNTGQFTAVGYYFARELRKELDVPIGLLNSSWGGSRIEPWMSAKSLEPFIEGGVEKYLKDQEQEQKATIEKMMTKIGSILNKKERTQSLKNGYDDSSWSEMTLPGLWEEQGYEGMDGTVTFRKVIFLSKEESESEIKLSLGMIDDSDSTFVNGQLVGSMVNQWNADRSYTVDASVLQEGENVIIVRVEDNGGGGGLYGEQVKMFYSSASGKTSLAGEWKFKVEVVGSVGIAPNQIPTILFNKMIHPILDFPIKGVIWYQGESNASAQDAFKYRELFPTMIEDWRKLWSIGDFPFLWVQLANFMQPDDQPSESSWAMLQESQSKTLSVKNTGQAVIIDIGEADDIHPRNKQDVGYRLSLAARKVAYGEDLIYSGPVYESMTNHGGSLLLSFNHTGTGLMVEDKYGYLKGFTVSGKDKVFKYARAKIEGDKVRVWSDEIPEPVHVRYAWASNPDDANLYNKEGLPAGPFRTDE